MQASETSGAGGSGVYSGKGVQPDGVFDPADAGLGSHIITYTYTSQTNCLATLSQTIDVLKDPYAADYSIVINPGESVRLKPVYVGDQLTYRWAPAEGLTDVTSPNPTVSPARTTTYSVNIANAACSYIAKITVNVAELPTPVNAFSPNGDGVNDLWAIKNIQLFPIAEVNVYNRYGIPVFYAKGLSGLWDGTYNNRPVPAGVYYYLIRTTATGKPITGVVTVIR